MTLYTCMHVQCLDYVICLYSKHVVTVCMLCGCILQALHMAALGLQLVQVIQCQFECEKHILGCRSLVHCCICTVPDCVGCQECSVQEGLFIV